MSLLVGRSLFADHFLVVEMVAYTGNAMTGRVYVGTESGRRVAMSPMKHEKECPGHAVVPNISNMNIFGSLCKSSQYIANCSVPATHDVHAYVSNHIWFLLTNPYIYIM